MSKNNLRVTVVSTAGSWMNKFLHLLITRLRHEAVNTVLLWDANLIAATDLVFFLGYNKIVSVNILKRAKHNLVAHASDLPVGKGWSPFVWQILEGKNEIPVVLFEAEEKVDSGVVYIRDSVCFNGDELLDEIRRDIGNKIVEMCVSFVKQYPDILKSGNKQIGQETYCRRRKADDSELNINKTIAEQFNLLRVVDRHRCPAFFYYLGKKYKIVISKY